MVSGSLAVSFSGFSSDSWSSSSASSCSSGMVARIGSKRGCGISAERGGGKTAKERLFPASRDFKHWIFSQYPWNPVAYRIEASNSRLVCNS